MTYEMAHDILMLHMSEKNQECRCHSCDKAEGFIEGWKSRNDFAQVYRELAIRFRQDNLVKFQADNVLVPVWVYLEGEVDDLAKGLLKSQGD